MKQRECERQTKEANERTVVSKVREQTEQPEELKNKESVRHPPDTQDVCTPAKPECQVTRKSHMNTN